MGLRTEDLGVLWEVEEGPTLLSRGPGDLDTDACVSRAFTEHLGTG
jgi:hypothetical protein